MKCGNATDNNQAMSFWKYSNSTLFFGNYSNSTLPGSNQLLGFDQFSNMTMTASGTSRVLDEAIGIGDSIAANGTDHKIPLRILDSMLGRLGDKSGSGSVDLQGGQYVDGNYTVPELKNLTVSAWVRPDYGMGSPVFTVVGDENAFVLALDNILPPEKVATFSVFDGIKWTEVTSSSAIPEQWTHLAATFNGTTIRIYVNGALDGSARVGPVPALVDGILVTRTSQNIVSNDNVTIGAYYEKERGETRNLFSGAISDVNLYGTALSPDQVQQIFHIPRTDIHGNLNAGRG